MRIRDIIANAGKHQGPDALNIVAFALSRRKEEVLTDLDAEIEDELTANIEGLIRERAKGKPLAYITGEKEFFSQPFFVDGRVLIPRPETELLVEEALAILERRTDMEAILDMGTGSGAIGATIARLSSKRVTCADISMDALMVAKKNGARMCASGQLAFVCSDLMGAVREGRKFDMIVANLPYVTDHEWIGVMREVKDYEPALALLGGADGLDIYRRLVRDLPAHLHAEGYVLLEIGPYGQAGLMADLFWSHGLTSKVKKDLAGRERVIIGSWTNS